MLETAKEMLAAAERDGALENYVDGEYDTIGGTTYEVASPFNGDYTVTITDSNMADTPRAIASASNAMRKAQDLDWEDRQLILEDAADDYRNFSDEEVGYFVNMLGKPRSAIEVKLDQAWETLEYLPQVIDTAYDEWARNLTKETAPGLKTVYKPSSEPISAFFPANDPSVPASVLGHAVATGNTAVVRPSSEDVYSTLKTAEALTENGYPDGALNVVLYDSSDDQNDVHRQKMLEETSNCIVFGGDDTVANFRDAAGPDTEMNFVGFGEGRANAYVFQDADVGKAVTSVIEGMTLWPNGCNATKAIRIEPGINGQFYETFKETLVDRLDGLTIGDPMDYWTEIGYQDPETIKFLEDRVAKRVASSADEVLYPETSEVGLNSDSLDIRVPPEDGGAVDEDGEPIQMRPIVIEAKSDDSEFMAEEYPGPVLGIMSVGGRELADSYEAAYGDDIPITMSLYTNDRSWFSSDHRGGLADFITRELDAHLYNVNTATSRMNPWLRHQGIDLVDEMTWVESWDTDPTLWKQGKKTPGFIME